MKLSPRMGAMLRQLREAGIEGAVIDDRRCTIMALERRGLAIGYLERAPAEIDRYICKVYLTVKGENFLKKMKGRGSRLHETVH